LIFATDACEGRAIGLSGARPIGSIDTVNEGDAIMKSGLAALCAAAVCTTIAFSAAPALAQSRMKTCADEWNAKKAANETGGVKYRDFVKECLARSAAAPSTQEPAAPGGTATAPSAAKPAPGATATAPSAATPAPGAKGAVPAAPGEAVFPTAVNPKYAKESAGRARMHTCLDQYHENKANNSNGGLNWIQKGGGYYSECTKRLKG
jgi:hypothetical protein